MSTSACSCLVQRVDVFGFLRFLMRITSMYPLEPDNWDCPTPFARMLVTASDWLIEIFLYFCTLHVVVLFVCTLYLRIGDEQADLDFIVNCLMQVGFYSWAIVMKVYFRRVRPQALQELMYAFNTEYRTRSAIGFTYVTMAQAIAQSSNWFRYYVYLCIAGTMFWCILPLVYNDRSLPLPCWYPFDYKAPLVYETIYFLQFVAQVQLATAYACSSGFYMVFVMLLCGQYDVLYCSLKNLMATAYIESRKSPTEIFELKSLQLLNEPEVAEYHNAIERITPKPCLWHSTDYDQPFDRCDVPVYKIALKNSLRSCVVLQRRIVSMLCKLEKFYSAIWFFKYGEMTSLLCLVAFLSVKTPATSVMKMISLIQYIFLISLEMMIIFYYGEVINFNSQRCGEALMRSPWHLYMQDMRSDILFFLLNSKRAFQLTAGKVYALNIERAKSTVTTAFSFLTLLQKMDQRN